MECGYHELEFVYGKAMTYAASEVLSHVNPKKEFYS